MASSVDLFASYYGLRSAGITALMCGMLSFSNHLAIVGRDIL